MTLRPVAVDPVKTILATWRWPVSNGPIASPPATALSTPGGSAPCRISTSRSVPSGVNGEGLMTTVLPARIAGTTCQIAIISGQFHGVIDATTPSGLRCSVMCAPASSWIVSTGKSSVAAWRAHAAAPPTSKRAPKPPSGLPCSRLSSCASSSACASIRSPIAAQAALRASSLAAAQPGNAAAAAATAASTCAAVATGAWPTTAPVAGSSTATCAAVATDRPSISRS